MHMMCKLSVLRSIDRRLKTYIKNSWPTKGPNHHEWNSRVVIVIVIIIIIFFFLLLFVIYLATNDNYN